MDIGNYDHYDFLNILIMILTVIIMIVMTVKYDFTIAYYLMILGFSLIFAWSFIGFFFRYITFGVNE